MKNSFMKHVQAVQIHPVQTAFTSPEAHVPSCFLAQVSKCPPQHFRLCQNTFITVALHSCQFRTERFILRGQALADWLAAFTTATNAFNAFHHDAAGHLLTPSDLPHLETSSTVSPGYSCLLVRSYSSIHPSTYLTNLSIQLSNLSIHLSINRSINLPIYLIYLSNYHPTI